MLLKLMVVQICGDWKKSKQLENSHELGSASSSPQKGQGGRGYGNEGRGRRTHTE